MYRCAYLFPLEIFSDIIFGSDIVVLQDKTQFDDGGLQMTDILPNDVFIRAGQWASCVKRELQTLVHKKYTDANTYTKTLKLGFRLKPEDHKKRVICYVKLLGCLESLHRALSISNTNNGDD